MADANPYEPPSAVLATTHCRAKRLIFATIATGFFAGTATHWIFFWTDTISIEFPPMGGTLLGLIVSLCLAFPVVREPRLFFGLAFLFGHLNAAFCRPLSLLNPFNAIPRNFVMAWTSAIVAFALSLIVFYTAICAFKRWRASRDDASLDVPRLPGGG